MREEIARATALYAIGELRGNDDTVVFGLIFAGLTPAGYWVRIGPGEVKGGLTKEQAIELAVEEMKD